MNAITKHKKTILAHLKSTGQSLSLEKVSKIAVAADQIGVGPIALLNQIGAGSYGDALQNLVTPILQLKGGVGTQDMTTTVPKPPHGLAIADLATGKVLRRVSMEDYFYLKSLARRRRLGTHHSRGRYAIVKDTERVVKI